MPKRSAPEQTHTVQRRRTRVSATPDEPVSTKAAVAPLVEAVQPTAQPTPVQPTVRPTPAVDASGLSAYDLQRNENIRRNNAILSDLGLTTLAAELKQEANPKKPVKGAAVNRKAKPERPPIRQRSLRAQNLDADGQPLPEKPVVPATPMPEPRKARKPSVPLDASKVSTGATSAEEAAAFLARLDVSPAATPAAKKPKASKKGGKTAAATDAQALELLQLQVAEDDIAKLVPALVESAAC